TPGRIAQTPASMLEPNQPQVSATCDTRGRSLRIWSRETRKSALASPECTLIARSIPGRTISRTILVAYPARAVRPSGGLLCNDPKPDDPAKGPPVRLAHRVAICRQRQRHAAF